MRAVADQLRVVLDTVRTPAPRVCILANAAGCLLAQDAVATYDLPPFTNSSMDGYAVRSVDVAAAGPGAPVLLPVVGDLAAGSTPGRGQELGPGQAMRIMTGAPLPAGADAVVPQEWTDQGAEQVRIDRPATVGGYVRDAGSDLTAGATVLTAGSWLDPRRIGLLAAAGFPTVLVRPWPRVVVLSTGSELHEPGTPLGPGQIADSNSAMLRAAATEAGAVVRRLPPVRDDAAELAEVLSGVLADRLAPVDLVITTGGASVGAYDVVRDVLPTLGDVVFGPVAMQPGMPQGFGVIGEDRVPVFALPGNPVSAYVSFEVFARPAIRRLAGRDDLFRPTVPVRLADEVHPPADKTQFLRVRLDHGIARSTGGTGSHLLAGLAAADALVIVPAGAGRLPAGSVLDAMVLDGSAPTTPLLP